MSFKKATTAYSVAHFVVDFSCAFLVFSYLHGVSQWLLCLLVYNFFAFAMQMPLGIIADYFEKNKLLAAAGCIIVALSALLSHAPIALCIFAGLGNGLFHIGAGRDVLVHSDNSYSLLGIFVSPGALGLYLGTLAGKERLITVFVPVFLLILSSGIILLMAKNLTVVKPTEHRKQSELFALLGGMLLCLFLVVCIRSYVGMTLNFPWKAQRSYSLWLLLALALGKAVGGVLADWLGDRETAVLSLLASALLFVFHNEPVCGILSVFFFNMSMPITLGAVTRILPEHKGFGFGLLTFGLFIGFLPVIFGRTQLLTLPWGYCASALFSAVILFIGLGGPRRGYIISTVKSA